MQFKYRTLFVVFAAAAASGCAAPIGLQIASWAMSGVSYATTGKSLSDHAISAVFESDCALHRVLIEGNLCVSSEAVAVDTVLAQAEISPPESANNIPTEIVAEIEREVTTRPVALTVGPSEQVGLFVVAGSFQDRRNADTARGRYERAAIAHADIKGAHYYRVVVGPVEKPQWQAAAKELERGGAKGVWPVRLCSNSLTPPPCAGEHTILAEALFKDINEVL